MQYILVISQQGESKSGQASAKLEIQEKRLCEKVAATLNDRDHALTVMPSRSFELVKDFYESKQTKAILNTEHILKWLKSQEESYIEAGKDLNPGLCEDVFSL